MMTHATPADAQLVLIECLRPLVLALYPDAHVGARVPDQRPAYVVTVRRDGGPMVDEVQDQAQVGINVWAPTERACFVLASQVERWLMQSPDGGVILGVTSVSGPAPVPEDGTTQSHIYMTFEAVLRGLG